MITVDIDQKIPAIGLSLEVLEEAIKEYLLKQLEKRQILIELVLTGPDEIEELNTKYRNKPQPTDVLSFPIWDHKKLIPEDDAIINLGTIVLNLEQAKVQAGMNERNLTEECIFLAKHSIDHLLGKHHKE